MAGAMIMTTAAGISLAFLINKKEREQRSSREAFTHTITVARETASVMADAIETNALYDIEYNGRTYTVARTSTGVRSVFLKTERGYERANLPENEESKLFSKLQE